MIKIKTGTILEKIPLTLLIIVFSAAGTFAQWQPDVRMTADTANSYTSYNNAWCTAASGNEVHIIWWDGRDGNNEIYYKRSTNSGISWGADTRLTNNPAASEYPCVTASGTDVHVAWNDDRDGNREIYYKHSTDGGQSWGADTRLTNAPDVSVRPSIAVSGSVVHVAWFDNRDGFYEMYYKRSTDGGISWGADTRLTNDLSLSFYASISVSGLFVHVVWQENRDGNWEIYYKRSTDGGVSWGADTRLTNNTATSNNPCASVSGSAVHVVWTDNRDGNYEIYYKRSTDGGATWGADTRLINNPGTSWWPSVSVSGSSVHVVWEDISDGNSEIYYKRSTDAGISWETDTRLTNNPYDSWYPSVSVSGSLVNVVWEEDRDGNFEIYYKRNPTGNPTEIININSEIPKQFSLSQNYPNPFNPVTNIKFQIPNAGLVKLAVFDLLGREVEILINRLLSPGTYQVDFNAGDYTSGIYFYRLETGGHFDSKKMMLIK